MVYIFVKIRIITENGYIILRNLNYVKGDMNVKGIIGQVFMLCKKGNQIR